MLPSGEKLGSMSLFLAFVSWVAVPPAAGIFQISKLPVRFEVNATMPLRDQAGIRSKPAAFVRFVALRLVAPGENGAV